MRGANLIKTETVGRRDDGADPVNNAVSETTISSGRERGEKRTRDRYDPITALITARAGVRFFENTANNGDLI